ncbi:MAG: exopolyphosphatase [Thermodesulfobacteriota bacterium]|nr:exopolyphosphatase [Thermodesulfobacteriota bacterium]
MRLITRADFDGLVCAVLLAEMGVIDEYKFVHPKDVQDGKIEATDNDVMTNIPYMPGCGLWFDHHVSEIERRKPAKNYNYKGLSKEAPSCARVVYDYYGGAEVFSKFDKIGLMQAVDKSDSAQFNIDEVLNPKGWILLSFVLDSRTGLGRCSDFRISNFQLMEDMIKYCRTMTADEILEIPDVKERITKYHEQEDDYEKMIRANSTVDENVLFIDLRDVDRILPGNRFKEYVLFPDQNISMRILWGYKRQNLVITCGHSIINRTSNTHVARLMMKYGGGGHRAVGTCQIPVEGWEEVRDAILRRMKADG